MNFLNSEIGSAKDNQKSPIHNWYKFTAGFSYKFVEEIIELEKLKKNKKATIFDPFAGCGTTLVSSQKEGIRAVGNESQSFMYDVIKAKLNWNIKENIFREYFENIKIVLKDGQTDLELNRIAHPLLKSLYRKDILNELYLIKFAIGKMQSEKYKLFFKLALSQTLHKVSIHPIAIPYISRNKTLSNNKSAWEVFSEICLQMFNDLDGLFDKILSSKVYKHDSRKPNRFIETDQCSICITSPPYLNNLDYGEVSKVHTHFFELTKNWNDITQKVRKNLVTGATTHYMDSEFDLDKFLLTDFAIENSSIINELVKKSLAIKKNANCRGGKKSFNILILLYFRDMFSVLKEIRRVIKDSGKAYLIIGDSAPYGVHISTTKLLAKISQNTGFSSYEIHKIRTRGTKWKSLKFRHDLELSENVLILK